MHEQDILDLMLSALTCDPHGAFSAKDKRLQFDRLREHAAALVRCMHGSLTVQEPSEHRPNACLTLGVPLPVVVLNDSVRRHFSMLMALSDSISLSGAGGCLRIGCTVCGAWESA